VQYPVAVRENNAFGDAPIEHVRVCASEAEAQAIRALRFASKAAPATRAMHMVPVANT
jgi:hypothetical protein